MKKIAWLAMIIAFSWVHGPGQDKVDRVWEHGEEVVLNKIEPYKIKGEPGSLILSELFTIDTQEDNIAKTGLSDIVALDVDSKGSIYLLNPKAGENLIYKFSQDGNFVTSFGRKGQGPGELRRPEYLVITNNGEVAITDIVNHRLAIFRNDGNLKSETPIDINFLAMIPLENKKYLVWKKSLDPTSEFLAQNTLNIYSSDSKMLTELDKQNIPNPMVGKSLKGTFHVFSFSISKNVIYTGFQERGYDIYQYNFEGKLLRRIKKIYKEIPVPKEHKTNFMKMFEGPVFDDIRKKIFFPDYMPAYHAFFTDDEGRLFVMTYEKAVGPGDYIYNIFNADGVFISKKNLGIYQDTRGLYATIKNRRLYCLYENEAGYKELKVYSVAWE